MLLYTLVSDSHAVVVGAESRSTENLTPGDARIPALARALLTILLDYVATSTVLLNNSEGPRDATALARSPSSSPRFTRLAATSDARGHCLVYFTKCHSPATAPSHSPSSRTRRRRVSPGLAHLRSHCFRLCSELTNTNTTSIGKVYVSSRANCFNPALLRADPALSASQTSSTAAEGDLSRRTGRAPAARLWRDGLARHLLARHVRALGAGELVRSARGRRSRAGSAGQGC